MKIERQFIVHSKNSDILLDKINKMRQIDIKTDKMGLFNGIFGNTNNQSNSKLEWNYLESMEDLDAAEKVSIEKIVVFFKHSTRCSVSRFVLKQFENSFTLQENVALYFLDLIEYRPISNEIASRFNVVHQSPQMIVLKEGKVIYNASHESIDAKSLEQFV